MIFNKAFLLALKSGGGNMAYWPVPNFNTIKTQTVSRNSSYKFDHTVYVVQISATGEERDSAYVSINYNGHSIGPMASGRGSGHYGQINSLVPAGTTVNHSNYGSGGVEYCEIDWVKIPELTSGGGANFEKYQSVANVCPLFALRRAA